MARKVERKGRKTEKKTKIKIDTKERKTEQTKREQEGREERDDRK